MSRTGRGILVGLLGGLIGVLLSLSGVLQGLENLTWDLRVRALARPAASTEKVLVVALDQDSLNWAESELSLAWPWPRQVYEPLLAFGARTGLASFAWDVIFSEGSNLEGDDEILGQAIKAGPQFVGAMVLGQEISDTTKWPMTLDFQLPAVELVKGPGREEVLRGLRPGAAKTVLLPIPEVSHNAFLLANVGELPDDDMVIRRVTLVRLFDNRLVASLGLAAYLAATGETARVEPGRLIVGDKSIPIDPLGRAILNYRGPAQTHRSYSAAGIIQTELRHREGETGPLTEPARFRGAHAFFGFTAPGLHDLRASPLAAKFPGVEIQATVLDNLLNGDFMAEAPDWAVILGTLLVALLAGLVATGGKTGVAGSLAFIFLPIPALIGFGVYRQEIWSPVAGPTAGVLVALLTGILLNFVTEGRQRRYIKRAFKFYLSPDVIENILKDPDKLTLGGERRELSILFSDLQGFTSISEKLDPHDLTLLLNDYLTDMTDIILEEGGTLDKYEGDAIIAFWNAPLDQPDHALRSCRAAIRCQRKLASRKEEFAERAGSELKARIGIHTGPVVVGNMGSRSRFDYTVLGDAANLASRLEGANKVFGTFLMVSIDTWEALEGQLIGRELGAIQVVGRKTPVRVFEPQGFPDEEVRNDLSPGHQLIRESKWEEALAYFQSLEGDAAADVYAARVMTIMAGTEEEWDGVWRLTSK